MFFLAPLFSIRSCFTFTSLHFSTGSLLIGITSLFSPIASPLVTRCAHMVFFVLSSSFNSSAVVSIVGSASVSTCLTVLLVVVKSVTLGVGLSLMLPAVPCVTPLSIDRLLSIYFVQGSATISQFYD